MFASDHGRRTSSRDDFTHFPGKILIVEDEKIVAWDIEQTLTENGFKNIASTPSIAGALACIAQHQHIRLALLDLKLEDGNGEALIDVFRAHGIQVVVVTGYNHFRHPGVQVVLKPFESGELLAVIRSVCSREEHDL